MSEKVELHNILFSFLKDLPFGPARPRVDLPQADSTQKRVAIMPALDSFREFVQFFGVAAAQHDVVGNQRFLQLHERVLDVPLPGFLAELGQAGFSEIIFNDAAITVRQISQFQRKDSFFPNQGGTKPGAESEKKHSTAAITAKRLHGGVVDDANRFAECFLEIKSGPPFAEMFGIAQDTPVSHRRWKTNRDGIEVPFRQERLHLRHHFPWRHLWT